MIKNTIRVLYQFSEAGSSAPIEKAKQPKKAPVPPEIKDPIHDRLDKAMQLTELEQKLSKIKTLDEIKTFIAEVKQAQGGELIYNTNGNTLIGEARNKWETFFRTSLSAVKDLAGVKTFIAEVKQAQGGELIYNTDAKKLLETVEEKLKTLKN
jgi:chaperonin cofactor prefoldin